MTNLELTKKFIKCLLLLPPATAFLILYRNRRINLENI